MSEIKECSKCGKDYVGYTIFVKDNFVAMVQHESAMNEYDNLCKDCYVEECPAKEYVID